MSIAVMELAWYVQDLTPAQKATLVALADHASDDGTNVRPSVERLCLKTSYSERTIRRALGDLREQGLIITIREATFHHPTEYKMGLPEMQARQERPARDAPHDLPEMHPSPARPARSATEDLPESPERPARDAPKPSYNHQDQPSEKENDDDARASAEAATLELLDYWQDLTGSFAPGDNEKRAHDYLGPLNRLWLRVERDTGEAKRQLENKRTEMLSEGKTPYRPAAIVPAIFADLDGVQPRASPNGSHEPKIVVDETGAW